MHSGNKVIQCEPRPYIICRHGKNESYLDTVIEKDNVTLSIGYVECEYVWSQPTGESNASLSEKYLTKYQANTLANAQSESKSAAAMLRERDEQMGISSNND